MLGSPGVVKEALADALTEIFMFLFFLVINHISSGASDARGQVTIVGKGTRHPARRMIHDISYEHMTCVM